MLWVDWCFTLKLKSSPIILLSKLPVDGMRNGNDATWSACEPKQLWPSDCLPISKRTLCGFIILSLQQEDAPTTLYPASKSGNIHLKRIHVALPQSHRPTDPSACTFYLVSHGLLLTVFSLRETEFESSSDKSSLILCLWVAMLTSMSWIDMRSSRSSKTFIPKSRRLSISLERSCWIFNSYHYMHNILHLLHLVYLWLSFYLQ